MFHRRRMSARGPLLPLLACTTLAWAAAPGLAQAPATQPLVLDAHADIPNPLDHPERTATTIDAGTEVDIDKLRAGGVGAIILSIHAPKRAPTPQEHRIEREIADAKLKAIREIATRHPDKAAIALTAADVRGIAASGRVAIVLSVLNGSPYAQDADAVRALHDQGVRVIGFVHAGNNELADSSRPFARDVPGANGGLSPLGKQWVADANRHGVVLDVSQLTTQALLQTVALSKTPVLATHSGVRALVDSPRNLTEEELKAVADTGGAVCVVAFSSYLINPTPDQQQQLQAVIARHGGLKNGYEGLSVAQREALYADLAKLGFKATVDQYLDSVDHAVKAVGIDHVCLSTDFNHGSTGLIGWEDEGQTGNVTAALRKRGYSEADIGKLWSGNVLRVLEAAEAAAAR
ncbi:dipeptidase [Sphingobium baderi]|nr:membrane dipeptidase [Sphingobium baderi]